MKKLMNILFLSCKKATELIEKREIIPLSGMEKVQLKLHISMCDTCKAYKKQSKTIDKAISEWLNKDENKHKEELSKETKANIINKIKKN